MPELTVPPLSKEQVQSLLQALAAWAEIHPRRNQPLIAFADGDALSPRQLVIEVAKETPNGKSFLRMVRCGLEVQPFEEILAGFARVRGRG